MEKHRLVKISKFLSWALRHHPEAIGLQLQDNGWVSIDELLAKSAAYGQVFTEAELRAVVADNNKQRFALDEQQRLIRARQGHSTAVELSFDQHTPPSLLYHGTAIQAIEGIKKDGLLKMNRHHVHLSPDPATAIQVGSRKGKAIVLAINSGQMANDGFEFYLSENGVWLVESVPCQYIVFS